MKTNKKIGRPAGSMSFVNIPFSELASKYSSQPETMVTVSSRFASMAGLNGIKGTSAELLNAVVSKPIETVSTSGN